ncbi:PD-(D/E)XK nuclease family protein [Alkalithermobacter paradoxus]|uniref:PD-(D/E)XK nuclease superfamily protein n=1 Tax=Alkalithermobacter paradoxus TaxID=29349 RepID=A0A1V4IB94_9FIRM|nr:PD-(D/E)XK nuclease superfamily protein [[Clostridium] thermoalcaliphilum]
MLDVRSVKHFYYSQASLNTFLRCPLKFKIKYIERIHWQDDIRSEEISRRMQIGRDFHLYCERYFSSIPIGTQSNTTLNDWINNLTQLLPIDSKNIYLPEYEIRINEDKIRLLAKYDLIIIKEDGKIEIYDWKTEEKKLDKFKLENSFQTILYMYLLKRMSKKIFGRDISASDISMIYWQPQYKDSLVKIEYSQEKYKSHENYIVNVIDTINGYDFDNDFVKDEYMNECKNCEFRHLCSS